MAGSVRLLGLAARKAFVAPRDAVLSARMALWVALVTAFARATSLPRAQRMASVRLRPRAGADGDGIAGRLANTLDAVLALDVFVFRPCCWKRAMVLHRFLALEGIETRINFGVQTNASGPLQGHAWLERDGRPFLERTPGAYVVTFSLPRAAQCSPAPRP